MIAVDELQATLGRVGLAADRLSFLVLTRGVEPSGKIVLLVFADGEASPRLAVKLPRQRAQSAALEREARHLAHVRQLAGRARVAVPRVLWTGDVDGAHVVVESVIDGAPLWEVASRTGTTAYLDPVVDWLIDLGTASVRPPGPQDDGAVLAAVAADVRRAVRTSADHRRLVEVCRRINTVPVMAIPRVVEQRDLGPWNVMVARDGAVGILDWESSTLEGFPTWDLFYFLAHYGFMVHGAHTPRERLASFQETFGGAGLFGATASRAVRRYVGALGLEHAWIAPLFLGCWLHHTLSEISRLGIALENSLFWNLLGAALSLDCRLNDPSAAPAPVSAPAPARGP
jgi:aminoglycoside phosphotransferase (APT) family kinase protein